MKKVTDLKILWCAQNWKDIIITYDMVIWLHFHTDFVYCSQQGNIIPPSVKPGDEVLLPEYGGTKVVLEDKVYKKERKNEKLNKYIQKPILLYH